MSSILIVDDDSSVADLFLRVLTQAGYTASTAENGCHALELIANTNFDLILLDLVMPDVDGLEILRALRQARSTLKVIAISGMFHGKFLNAAKLLGAKAVLQKPIAANRLLKTVEEALNGH